MNPKVGKFSDNDKIQDDTGWIQVPLHSDFENYTADDDYGDFQYRVKRNILYLRGRPKKKTGTLAGGQHIGTLPITIPKNVIFPVWPLGFSILVRSELTGYGENGKIFIGDSIAGQTNLIANVSFLLD